MTPALGELMLECDEQAELLAVPKHQIGVLPIPGTAASVIRGRVGDLYFVTSSPGHHS